MAEYINREAVLAEMTSKPLPKDASHLYLAMRGIVSKAPTADVAEVKHAEWLSNAQTDEYSCSECDGIAPVDSEKEEFYESNYCPNCGAMMDSAEKFPNNTEHSVGVNKMVQNQWISVNKQLPETYIEVLVCFKADGSNVIAFLNRFSKWKNASTDNFIESEITHWMPLPKPPKGVM